MIRRYQSNLISFAYPENWKLEDSDHQQLPREVSVESPDGAIWIVHAFAPGTDPNAILNETVATFRENYEDFECSEVAVDLPVSPTKTLQADFFCLDFLVTAQIQVFAETPLTYLVVAQAENRQFEAMRSVFAAITFSLVSTTDITPEPEV